MFAHRAFTKITVNARACLASLWLLTLPVTDASAQGQAQRGNDPEVVKQQKIYRSQGEDVPRGYVVMRGLSHYAELLPAGFEQVLKKLGPDDRWLDIGAGSGQAVLDYYAPGYVPPRHNSWTPGSGRARVVAVSIEDRRSKVWEQETERLTADRVRYLFGKRLREYAKEELGTFQLITDVYGGFSYTDELSKFMEKVLGLLAVDGSFYTLLQSVKLEDARDDPRYDILPDRARRPRGPRCEGLLMAEKHRVRRGLMRIAQRLGYADRADPCPQGMRRSLCPGSVAAQLRSRNAAPRRFELQ